jgi:hypothetical protein
MAESALAPGREPGVDGFDVHFEIAGSRITGIAFGRELQQGMLERAKVQEQFGDLARAGHQVADEALQVVDQPLLEFMAAVASARCNSMVPPTRNREGGAMPGAMEPD